MVRDRSASSSSSSSSSGSSSSGSDSSSSGAEEESPKKSRSPPIRRRPSRSPARPRRPSRSPRRPSPPVRRQRSVTPPATKVHIGRLTRNVSKGHVMEIFSTYGSVRTIDMPLERLHPEFSRGYAYVEYEKHLEAQDAVKHMNGGQIDGAEVTVKMLLPERRFSNRGGGGGGGGYPYGRPSWGGGPLPRGPFGGPQQRDRYSHGRRSPPPRRRSRSPPRRTPPRRSPPPRRSRRSRSGSK